MENIDLNNTNTKNQFNSYFNQENPKLISFVSNNDINKNNVLQYLTIYILTRDFRTLDNLTLYKAYEEAQKSNTLLCVIFRFTNSQILKEENSFYSSNAVEFMLEALKDFSKEINITFIDLISDAEWLEFLKAIPIHKIFITRDFTPYSRKRFLFYSSIVETIEVDDITVFPVEKYKTFDKLTKFVEFVRNFEFPQIEERNIKWRENSYYLKDLLNNNFHLYNLNFNFLNSGHFPKTITDNYTFLNKNLKVRPTDLLKVLQDLNTNLIGYSNKKIRDLIGKPRVSYISSFLKFGLISIRTIHSYVDKLKSPSRNDITFFQRELYFRDFYYRAAYNKPEEVFEKPIWEETNPRFINEEDLLKWKAHKNFELNVTEEEKIDIQSASLVYEKWKIGQTEYPLVNAGIKELINTGYMLNKSRILASSYLTRDHRLWWKYAERFYANHLIDYDWTINTISHQNIAKIGYYPNKNDYDFSILKQQHITPEDKEEYYIRNKDI